MKGDTPSFSSREVAVVAISTIPSTVQTKALHPQWFRNTISWSI